jgi:hypothetical protein
MNYYLLATLEILLVIVSPLLILYLRGKWPLDSVIPSLLTTPILWYLTYSVLHELSHVAGTYLVGGTVTDVRLMPRFWQGEFGRAWITSVGITQPWRQLITSGFPYMLDIICVLGGIFLLRRHFSNNAFIVGLVFMLLILRPAFDFVCEPIAFLGGDKGDFHAINQIAGATVTWVFILLSLALCILAVLTILGRYAVPKQTVSPVISTAGHNNKDHHTTQADRTA